MRIPAPNPDVYYRAAERIRKGADWFSCLAINHSQPRAKYDNMHTAMYQAVMRPRQLARTIRTYGHGNYSIWSEVASGPRTVCHVPGGGYSERRMIWWNEGPNNCSPKRAAVLRKRRIDALTAMGDLVAGKITLAEARKFASR